jgi:hypothetical protein
MIFSFCSAWTDSLKYPHQFHIVPVCCGEWSQQTTVTISKIHKDKNIEWANVSG